MKRFTSLVVLAVLAGACAEPPTSGSMDSVALAAVVQRPAHAQVQRDLAALRAATAAFHRIEAADDAGYSEQFPPGCFTSDVGAMGFHYIKGELVGTLDPAQPQLVIYEPQKDGSQKLVGVEFIAPGSPDDTPPVLFGQDFNWNEQFTVWVLHVWIWRNNPAGMFENWNTNVSCQWADRVSATTHH